MKNLVKGRRNFLVMIKLNSYIDNLSLNMENKQYW